MKALVRRKWREGEERVFPKSWCQPIWDNDALSIAAMKYAVAKGSHTLVPPGNFEHFSFMLRHSDQAFLEPMNEAEWTMLRHEAKSIQNEMIF